MSKFQDNNIRASIDSRSEKIGAKIRDAELNKIPVMLIAGEKEEIKQSVSVRRRHLGDLGLQNTNSFIDKLVNEIITRRRV